MVLGYFISLLYVTLASFRLIVYSFIIGHFSQLLICTLQNNNVYNLGRSAVVVICVYLPHLIFLLFIFLLFTDHPPFPTVYFRAETSQMYSRRMVNPPFQAWIYHCHFHPLQAANCCRNSRLVVNENDLKRVANEKNISFIYYNSYTKIVILNP